MLERLRLEEFGEPDFDRLIAWVDDPRLLALWTGPWYDYPLTRGQLGRALKNARARPPGAFLFKAVLGDRAVGHLELLEVQDQACTLGRVLIGEKSLRGLGLGRQMVSLGLDQAFYGLGVGEVRLRVYTHNLRAVRLYESLGFAAVEAVRGEMVFQGEPWEALRMRLSRDRWLE